MKMANRKQKIVQEENEEEVKDDPCKDLKDRLARVLADYDNLTKRQAREREEIYLRATRNLVEDLLPTVDDLERAEGHLQDQGLKMGMDNFRRVLDMYGVVEISVKVGDNFDSQIHEAIESVEGESLGTIAQVFAKGYKWKDEKIIRPAKVSVYK